MPKVNHNEKSRKNLRIIVLAFIGTIAFLGSVATNIIGIKQLINKEPDSSGIVGFSVRTNNYFNNGEKKLDDSGKIIAVDVSINSTPLIKLNNNNWDRLKANFSNFEFDENNNAVFKEGYTLYCNGKYVKYVVFNSNYSKDVIGHLKVGENFKSIIDKIGEPIFRTDKCLGYKTKENYVFFYEKEICVYPNREFSNSRLEELLQRYLEKTYEKERTNFIVELRNNYEDFEFEYDEENNIVTAVSVNRQIKIKLDGLENIEVELYNGYKVANEKTNEFIKQKLYFVKEDDLVEISENERISVE